VYRCVRDEGARGGPCGWWEVHLLCSACSAVEVTGGLFGLSSASERCSMFPEGDQVGPDDLSFVPGEDSTR